MLSVDHYELIRRKHFVDGLSVRAISRELGHSRKTIRKVLTHGTPPGYQRRQPVSSPVMDPVAKLIEAWLDQDKTRHAKQRHTAQRMYERLRDEYGFGAEHGLPAVISNAVPVHRADRHGGGVEP
jgi:transposase